MHKHHIIPKHAGGSDDPSNLVELTVEEHAEAHRKLFEQYGRWQDEVAWKGLAGIIGHEESVRLAKSCAMRELWQSLTPEERATKIEASAKTRRGKPVSPKLRKYLDKTGISPNEDTRNKLRRRMIENNQARFFPDLSGDRNPGKRPDVRAKHSNRMMGNVINKGRQQLLNIGAIEVKR